MDKTFFISGNLLLKQRKNILLSFFMIVLFVAACETNNDKELVRSYAALSSLPVGAIKPEGWLKTYLEKQAAQLGYNLPKVSEPFSRPYWDGEEGISEKLQSDQYWWPWEQKGYWIDGALRCAILTGDSGLYQEALEPVHFTLTHSFKNGYLGPVKLMNSSQDNCRWPHTIIFRALSAYAEYSNDKSVAEIISRHYLSGTASYGGADRNVTNIETMLWCYKQTGEKKLLYLAEKAWADFIKVAKEGDPGDLATERVLSNKPIVSHGVTYAEKSKLPAILYLYTGKQDYLRFAIAAQKRIFDRYMLVDGIPSTSETYESITSRDVHETCDIADHTWSWGYLLMATGDAAWADHIERACFNAGFGAIKKDWKGVQYLSGPNQALSTLTSSHITNSGPCTMAYQPNPATWVACCSGNAHRIIPNYVIRMWMKNAEGGLTADLYGPCSVKAGIGKEKQAIEISEVTDYPFDEKINFILHTDKPVNFPLSFRIPAWCGSPQILINSKAIALPALNKGFVVLNQSFNPGDIITLILPMNTKISHWPKNGIALEHGPLVYSLPVKEIWTSVVDEPGYCTAEFPRWEARPGSPWNYGVAVTDSGTDSSVSFQQNGITQDPWVDPPVKLIVSVKRIDGWGLVFDPKDTVRKFTPPLPDLKSCSINDKSKQASYKSRDFLPEHFTQEKVKVLQTIEKVVFIPYGSTHLRMTIFPDVSEIK